jgi:glycosyltransferase involved in cell wall biosynthesis
VLGSDLGGLRECVVPGVNGWLEPYDDPQRWAARIDSLAEARGLVPDPMTVRETARPLESTASAFARVLDEAIEARGGMGRVACA